MRYLVTGGAGFIGSNLVESLVSDGHEVTIIDNYSTGSDGNLEGFFHKIYGHRRDQVSKVAFPISGIDGVFHLGIPSSPYLYRDDRNDVRIAINDWVTLLEAFKDTGTKIVFASTSSIYNGLGLPGDEDMAPIIKDFYTEVRYFMERLGWLYHDFYGSKVIGLRLFAVFGEREEAKKNFANVVTQMMWAKSKGEPFKIWGDGSQTRDLIYVKDVVRAFRKAMDSKIECDIFNVGNGEEWSLNRMAKAVGCKVEYVENNMQNYVDSTLAYLGKAQKKLGFQAEYGVWEQIMRLAGG